MAAAHEGPDARHEHREVHGLDDVVVGACVEPLDLIPLAVLRGQHEHGSPVAVLAERAAHPVAAHARHHDVEQDDVVPVLAREPQAVDAVVRDVDGEALGLEPATDPVGEPHLVVDDQHAHADSLGGAA